MLIKSFKISITLITAMSLLGTGLFSGCTKAPAPAEPASSAEPAEETQPDAERVRFADVSDGDRIILVNPNFMRTVALIPEDGQLVALAVRGSAEELTYFPAESGLFTCEKAEDGALRLKTEAGYLSAGAEENVLVCDAPGDTPAYWTLTDNELTVRIPGAAPEERCLYYSPEKNHCAVAEPGSISNEEYLEFCLYRVNPSYSPPQDDGSGYRLTVFETSDIHGHIAEVSEEETEYRLAWIAGMIRKARSASGTMRTDTSVLLDAGDLFQGSILSNLLNGDPISEAMDVMEYDAVTLGNHEFDWGIETVIDEDGTLKDYQPGIGDGTDLVPLVVSNLYQNGKQVPYAKDYIILDKTAVDADGNELPVRIGIIGFAENYSSSVAAKFFANRGFEIREDYDALSALAGKLKQEEHCDAVILLTHANAADTSAKLDQDRNFDLILGGHSHKSDMGRNEAGTVYASPAGNATAFVRSELVFDKDDAGNPVFRDVRGTNLLISTTEDTTLSAENESGSLLDKDIIAISDRAVESASEVLESELGYITESVRCFDYFPESGERGSTGGNFHTTLVRQAADADVAFFNRHGMREDLIVPEGEDRRTVTQADIYTLFPFEATIVLYELTMQDLLEVFDYALTQDGYGLLSMMSGITCYYTGRTVNALIKDGVPLYVHGTWLDGHENDTVTVAVQDYIATSNRTKDGMDNPLYLWYGTDRMITDEIPTQTNYIRLLQEEAAANDGHLTVSDECWFINGDYTEN